MEVEEMKKITCDKEGMEDKIVTFSKFGDTGKGGITRLSLSKVALQARENFQKNESTRGRNYNG